jgi:hypothetical protein
VQYPAGHAGRPPFRGGGGVSEVLRGKVSASSGFRSGTRRSTAYRLNDHLAVSNLGNQMRYGDSRP